MIALSVNEGSTVVFTITIKDSFGNDVIPLSSEYQLSRSDGVVVNDRSFANGAYTGELIVLSGPDLELDESGDVQRILSIQGTYDSSYGTALCFTAEQRFYINNLIAQ